MSIIHAEHLFGQKRQSVRMKSALQAVANPVYEDIDECLRRTVREMRYLQKEYALTCNMQVGLMLNNIERGVDEMVGVI